MIEKFEDLGLETTDDLDKIDVKIKEKLGISFTDMTNALSEYVISHAEELARDFVNIAPFGDYSKLLEDNDSMREFLKNEAHKPEHWLISSISPSDLKKDLISFNFINKSVDDGDIFQGFVYVSFGGKIKHAFAQGDG